MDKEDWNVCLRAGREITRNAFEDICRDGFTLAEKNLTRYKQLSEPELIEPDLTDFLDNLVDRSESSPTAWDSLIRIESYVHGSGAKFPVPVSDWRVAVNKNKAMKKPGLKQTAYGHLITTDKPGVLQQVGIEEHKVPKGRGDNDFRDMAVITAIVNIINTLAEFDIKATRNDGSKQYHSAADIVVMERHDSSLDCGPLTYRTVKDIWDKTNDITNWQYGFRVFAHALNS